MTPNWRGRDVAWFYGLSVACGACADFGLVSLSIAFGAAALLTLAEAILHAIADAMKDDK